ncbi:MAG: thiamine-phosphate kinase [Chloroflexota bacterium]
MKVSEIGQFGLIDRLAKLVNDARDDNAESWRNLVLGVGDDCAAWRCNSRIQLSHVDCQIDGIHFRPEFGTWEELGWKALAVITSDIAAKGGSPRYVLVSLTLPEDTEVESVTSLYKGMLKLAKETGQAIVGGHISRGDTFSVTLTVHGDTGDAILLRSAAKPGDRIAVTGYLGGAAAYVEMFHEKLKFKSEIKSAFKQAFLHPMPRIAEGKLLVKSGIKAAMDISDGVMSDLRHILKASRVGARIDADKVPVLPEVKEAFGSQALDLALGGGGDYELLFTGDSAAIARIQAKSRVPVTVIGEITSKPLGEINVTNKSGERVILTRSGWDHFTVKSRIH